MRTFIFMILAAAYLLLTGCDVHQWPERDQIGEAELVIRLNFHPVMTVWEHYYDIDTKELTEAAVATPESYDNTQHEGFIRYIVRIYPRSDTRSAIDTPLQEYLFTSELDGQEYDFETTATLPWGEYTVMAWADIRETYDEAPRYDASDFAQVVLLDHTLNTDYRDAFCGTMDVTVDKTSSSEPVAQTVQVEMRRPQAKFQIIAEGVEDFIQNAATRNDLSDYKVILAYTGYTPFAYSVLTDLLVDSRYNERFESAITALDSSSISLAVDYFLVRADETSTRVQIGVFDAAGQEIAMTDPFLVPLLRDRHTIIRGKFLAAHASGGFVGIDPGFDGDINIVQ
ncbi:MAG: FimB/Mfa2 family fimbrial subunit [Alistipes sp.]|nr:FimB/Mfa2 family fimbrial subunit [Alistipes sp.]